MQLRADRGVDPVGADEQVGLDRAQLAGRPLADLGHDATGMLLEALEREAARDDVRAQALLHGAQQQHLQLAAMDRDLRPAVAGGAPARLAVDAAAEAVVVDELLRRDAGGLDLLAEPELGELADGVRQQVDAGAVSLDAAGRLDDLDLEACLVQAERGGEAADPTARDEHPHERYAPNPAAGNCSWTIITGRPPALIA